MPYKRRKNKVLPSPRTVHPSSGPPGWSGCRLTECCGGRSSGPAAPWSATVPPAPRELPRLPKGGTPPAWAVKSWAGPGRVRLGQEPLQPGSPCRYRPPASSARPAGECRWRRAVPAVSAVPQGSRRARASPPPPHDPAPEPNPATAPNSWGTASSPRRPDTYSAGRVPARPPAAGPPQGRLRGRAGTWARRRFPR